ncbi:MAG: hypothetical protein ACRC1M_05755 [Methanobacteriaceae archaeon]
MTELETLITVEIDENSLVDLASFDFLDQSAIDGIYEELENSAKKAVPNIGKGLEDWIKFEINKQQLIDTGNMLGSVYSYQLDDLSIYVDVAATEDGYSYPEGVEYGTSPHIIEGNPWLYWPGAKHPVRRVQHPGTMPTPFVEPARDALENQIERLFE